ncbi:hypothetical protein [Herbaspirillum lusitanum]|uniref:hypothetical protein n=1 Tax=Herbaspirillum lusitanum TaxID=213312 RepID=UPI00223803E6|nr:hypothetical protein [Herbaspirillum lusitanum]
MVIFPHLQLDRAEDIAQDLPGHQWVLPQRIRQVHQDLIEDAADIGRACRLTCRFECEPALQRATIIFQSLQLGGQRLRDADHCDGVNHSPDLCCELGDPFSSLGHIFGRAGIFYQQLFKSLFKLCGRHR